MEGDVTVGVTHSTVNYKDGLAMTGKSPVVRRWPMIPGIDFAGTVEDSSHPDFKPGDKVVHNGWGLGETHLGGYRSRTREGRLARTPAARDSRAEAMAIGTAGYTAMLSVMALEAHEVTPAKGPMLVTGAAGGVGASRHRFWRSLANRHSLDGRPEEGRLSQVAWRLGNYRPARAFGAWQVARQANAGPAPSTASAAKHPRQCPGTDQIWRRGRGLRLGAGMDLPPAWPPSSCAA